MDNKSIDEIHKEYLKIIYDLYPGQFDNWGIYSKRLGNYTEENLKKNLKKLYKLTMNNQINGSLKKQIMQRIFEIDFISEWKTNPLFYVDKGIESIIDLLTYPNLQVDNIKEILKSRVKYYPSIVENSMKNLMVEKLSYEQMKLSILRINNALSILKKFDLELYTEVFEESLQFEKFLSNALCNKRQSFYIDRNIFYKFLDIYDIKLDVDKLYESLNNFILNDIEYLDLDKRTNEFRADINFIYDRGKEIFGESEYLTDRLEIRINESNVPTGFFYPSVNLKKSNSIYCMNSCLKDFPTKHFLNIVHEIYPGHFHFDYMKKIKRAKVDSTYDNLLIEEGWAKFCEYVYAFEIIDSYDLKLEFINKLKKSCVAFCIFYELMFLDMRIEDIIKNNKYQNIFTLKQIISIYFSICENFTMELSYILGFCQLYDDYKDNKSIDKLISKYVLCEKI